MKIFIFFSVIFMICNLSAEMTNTQDAQKSFVQANKDYEDSGFETAISVYESLVNKGINDAKLFYNLGNTYYRINKLGKAILCYERALKLSPRDDDTIYNLKYIRSFIKEPEESIFYKIANFFTLNSIILFSSIIYFLFIMCIIVSLFYSQPLIKYMNMTLGIVLFFSLIWFYSKFTIQEKTISAIVTTLPAEVRNGPGDDYSVGFTLPEGKKVVILGEKDKWYAIAIKQYKPQKVILKGWLTKAVVEKI